MSVAPEVECIKSLFFESDNKIFVNKCYACKSLFFNVLSPFYLWFFF